MKCFVRVILFIMFMFMAPRMANCHAVDAPISVIFTDVPNTLGKLARHGAFQVRHGHRHRTHHYHSYRNSGSSTEDKEPLPWWMWLIIVPVGIYAIIRALEFIIAIYYIAKGVLTWIVSFIIKILRWFYNSIKA